LPSIAVAQQKTGGQWWHLPIIDLFSRSEVWEEVWFREFFKNNFRIASAECRAELLPGTNDIPSEVPTVGHRGR
jgi:hypothetical protein